MCDWPSIDAAANGVMQDAFGEPVLYQSGSSDPITITAIRHTRVREESGAAASTEEISVNPADLPNFPQRGDVVTAWGSQFVVMTARQPDPYGLVEITLTMRATPLPNAPAPPPAS
jgi:hypothetical protein